MSYRSATALDVRAGDTIVVHGYRATASDITHTEVDGHRIARYTLTSAPGDGYAGLPPGFDGMRSGGNHLARVAIRVAILLLLASTAQAVEVVSTTDDWVSHGRAAVVAPNLVITAAHTLEPGGVVTVNGRPATVEATDQNRDWALLRVDGLGVEPREIGSEPPVGSTVFVETGRGRIPAVVTTAGLTTSQPTRRGDSGSPIIDSQGRVVGVHLSRGGNLLKPAWLAFLKPEQTIVEWLNDGQPARPEPNPAPRPGHNWVISLAVFGAVVFAVLLAGRAWLPDNLAAEARNLGGGILWLLGFGIVGLACLFGGLMFGLLAAIPVLLFAIFLRLGAAANGR